MTELRVLRYGEVPYGQALALQLELRQRLITGEDHAGWIVCIEHPPVVTLGKRGRESDLTNPQTLREKGVELFRVDRGGEATYHGPGQLVIYPIISLERVGIGIVDVVRSLAGALADAVAEYGVETRYDPEHPGLWTVEEPARKMGSVGMRVSRGVSTHGAALNVVNNLIPFSWFVACGMPNVPMTRLADYVDDTVSVSDVADSALEHLARRIGATLIDASFALPPKDAWEPSLPLPNL